MTIRKFVKNLSVFLILLVFLLEATGLSYASVTMEEVMKLFNQKTGRQWEDVTPEVRRNFLYKTIGIKKREERKKRIQGVNIPFHIREGYKRKTGKKWEDATEGQQQAFISDKKVVSAEWKQKDDKRIRDIELEEAEYRRLQEAERQERERKRVEREQVRTNRRNAVRAKRAQEKARLQEAKNKLQEMRNRNRR